MASPPRSSRAPARRYSQDPEAYHAFKRGQHLWKILLRGRLASGDRALPARDRPRPAVCARARGARQRLQLPGLLLPGQAEPGVCRRADARPNARWRSIRRSASAFIELALARFGGDWDWDGAEQAFRRGSPSIRPIPLAHVHYSWLLRLLGREDAALAEAQRGQALAPSSRLVAGARAQTMYVGRPVRRSHRHLQRMPARSTRATCSPFTCAALCYLAKSMRDDAVADLEQAAALSHRAPFYLGDPRPLLRGVRHARGGARPHCRARAASRPTPTSRRSAMSSSTRAWASASERSQYQEKAYEDGASPFNYLSPVHPRPVRAVSASQETPGADATRALTVAALPLHFDTSCDSLRAVEVQGGT